MFYLICMVYKNCTILLAAPIIEKSNDAGASILVRPGDNVTLVCQCNQCKPLSLYYWLGPNLEMFEQSTDSIDNMMAKRIDSVDKYNNNRFEYHLTIYNVNEENGAGEYLCHVANEYGDDTLVYKIEVMTAPNIEQIKLDDSAAAVVAVGDEKTVIVQQIVEGTVAHIKCKVTGTPQPAIEWFKDDASISYGQRM